MITRDDLSAVWPEVSRRLTKLLMSRGAAADVADDVVQEVAARVLDKGVVFDDAMDLMRWAVPVALNLLVDNARATARVTPVVDGLDSPVGDVADLVAHRDRLGRVLRALPLLSAADRAALTGVDAPADRKEAVRLAVRRHRARRRLLALVDGVAAFAALLLGGLRRLGRTGATATVALAAAPAAFFLVPSGPAVAPAVDPAPEVAVTVTRPVRAQHLTPRPPAQVTAPAPAKAAAGAPRRPARPAAAAPRDTDEKVAEVDAPGNRLTVTERKPSERDGLVCLRDSVLIGSLCVLGQEQVERGL